MAESSDSDNQERPESRSVGTFIRAQRQLANLSLRQLSSMADVSNAYLSQIERGLHEPSIRVLRSVSEALGLDPETMLTRAGLLPKQARAGNDVSSVEEAVAADSQLNDDEKQALLTVYRSYLAGK